MVEGEANEGAVASHVAGEESAETVLGECAGEELGAVATLHAELGAIVLVGLSADGYLW